MDVRDGKKKTQKTVQMAESERGKELNTLLNSRKSEREGQLILHEITKKQTKKNERETVKYNK